MTVLVTAGVKTAPWPVVVFVSCLPVLGAGAALAHLVRQSGGGVMTANTFDVPGIDKDTTTPLPPPDGRGPHVGAARRR